jgi:hypothetical protein
LFILDRIFKGYELENDYLIHMKVRKSINFIDFNCVAIYDVEKIFKPMK